MNKPRDWQETVKLWATVFALVALPILLHCTSTRNSTSLQRAETRARYVELALQFLENPPRVDNVALRDWAVDILAENAPIELSLKAKGELKSGQVLRRESKVVEQYFEETWIHQYCTIFARQEQVLQAVRSSADSAEDDNLKELLRKLLVASNLSIRASEENYEKVLLLRAGFEVDSTAIKSNVKDIVGRILLEANND